MNSFHLYLALFTVLEIAAFYIAFLGIQSAAEKFKAWRAARHRFATKVVDSRLCTNYNDPHDWIEIRWRENDQVTEVRACRECGFIPDKNAMVTQESLPFMDQWYRRKILIRDAREQFMDAEGDEIAKLGKEFHQNPTAENFQAFYGRALTTHERMQAVLDAKIKEFEEQENKNERGN